MLGSLEYSFKVRVETALFMHGGRRGQRAELRAPSFRGLMRYWFRAISGGLCNRNQLLALERQLFGFPGSYSAGRSDTGRLASPFALRVIRPEGRADDLLINANLLPHKKSGNNEKQNEQNAGGRRKGPPSVASAIKPGTEFEIRLSPQFAPRSSDELKLSSLAMEGACRALWVALTLGGGGLRSRRGAGSLSIISITTAGTLPKGISKFSQGLGSDQIGSDEVATRIGEGLKSCYDFFGELVQRTDKKGSINVSDTALEGLSLRDKVAASNIAPAPEFPQLYHPREPGVVVLSGPIAPASEPEEAVRAQLMLMLRPFKNSVFGLPLQIGGAWVARKRRNNKGAPPPEKERFASPLWLRLMKVGGEWRVIATALKPLPRTHQSDAKKLTAFMAEGMLLPVQVDFGAPQIIQIPAQSEGTNPVEGETENTEQEQMIEEKILGDDTVGASSVESPNDPQAEPQPLPPSTEQEEAPV